MRSPRRPRSSVLSVPSPKWICEKGARKAIEGTQPMQKNTGLLTLGGTATLALGKMRQVDRTCQAAPSNRGGG